MALVVTSSFAISTTISYSSFENKAPQIGSFWLTDRSNALLVAMSFSRRRSAVKLVNAKLKRNDSTLSLAATIVALEVAEKIEVEDFEGQNLLGREREQWLELKSLHRRCSDGKLIIIILTTVSLTSKFIVPRCRGRAIVVVVRRKAVLPWWNGSYDYRLEE